MHNDFYKSYFERVYPTLAFLHRVIVQVSNYNHLYVSQQEKHHFTLIVHQYITQKNLSLVYFLALDTQIYNDLFTYNNDILFHYLFFTLT